MSWSVSVETHELTDRWESKWYTDQSELEYHYETAAEKWKEYVDNDIDPYGEHYSYVGDFDRRVWSIEWFSGRGGPEWSGKKHPLYDIANAKKAFIEEGKEFAEWGRKWVADFCEGMAESIAACEEYEQSWRAAIAAHERRDLEGVVSALITMGRAETEIDGAPETTQELASELLRETTVKLGVGE